MKIIRYLIALVVVLLIVVIIGKQKGWFGGPGGIAVNMDTVKQRDIVETVTASGKIYPVYQVSISAEISGEITQLNVYEGQSVKQGELLMLINPNLYSSQVEQAQASLDNAKANLSTTRSRVLQTEQQYNNAVISFNRSQQLYNEKVIAQADYEQAQLAMQTSKAEFDIAKENVTAMEYTIKSSEAALREMQNNFKRTSIYAPVSGTIFGLSKKKGEKVLGTIQMSGDVLMNIADLNNMEVQVNVSENDVLRINWGDTATIEVDAYLDRKFKGVVTQIANSAGGNTSLLSAASSEQATNFLVKILILPESYSDLLPQEKAGKFPFYPGMSATAEIKTNVAKNVITVPIQAITTREDSTKGKKQDSIREVVFIVDAEGKAKETNVKTGIQDDDYIQIISGLNSGQKIISGPYNTVSAVLKNGDKVKEETKKKETSKK